MKNAHVVTKTIDGRIIERFRNDKLIDRNGNELNWFDAEKLSESELNNIGIYIVEHVEENNGLAMEGYSFFLDEYEIPQIKIEYRKFNFGEISIAAKAFIETKKSGFIFKFNGKHFHSSVNDYLVYKDIGYQDNMSMQDNDFNVHKFTKEDFEEYMTILASRVKEIYKIERDILEEVSSGKYPNIQTVNQEIFIRVSANIFDKEGI